MKKKLILLTALFIAAAMLLCACGPKENDSGSESGSASENSAVSGETLEITEDELYDKLLGSWIGQIAGVVWGFPTEFHYLGAIIPDDAVPDISTLNYNDAFGQDDLYVEIPFMEAMKKHGVSCGIDKIGEAFAKTEFGLDHANKIARENLRKGIEAKLAGSYLYNYHCDDIDWQIEADFLGHIYPGLVNSAAERAFEIGHIINYGDGVYGGVFVAAMHSAAFTAKSVDEIIEAGIAVIPEKTKFREVMDDVIKAYDDGKSWKECWELIEEKWGKDDRCLWYANSASNIDAKINSAYILIGLLYGEGDMEKSMKISMQCGQDSDCNPSSVGAILGNFYGYKKLDEKWKTGIEMNQINFSYTDYSLKECVDLNFDLMLELLEEKGFQKDGETWRIVPEGKDSYKPVAFEQWPDQPSGEITVTVDKDIIRMSMNAHDLSGIESVKWDMGDGNIFNGSMSVYRYTELGTYEVVCTVTAKSGNSLVMKQTVEITSKSDEIVDPDKGEYRNVAKAGLAICTDLQPTGSGSKDISIITDGVKSGGNEQQYDTYAGYLGAHEDHIGYYFYNDFKLDKVVFTEGMQFGNGGWFANGTLKLQALTENGWVDIDTEPSPEYPNSNLHADFGANYETFTFEFDEIVCSGIRLVGTAGGDAGFISCAELEVYGVEA